MTYTINGGCIDPVNAKINGAIDRSDRIFIVLRPPTGFPVLSPHRPGSQADWRNQHVCIAKSSYSQSSSFFITFLSWGAFVRSKAPTSKDDTRPKTMRCHLSSYLTHASTTNLRQLCEDFAVFPRARPASRSLKKGNGASEAARGPTSAISLFEQGKALRQEVFLSTAS